MYFTYDRYKNMETPNVFLAYPSKKVIGQLNVHELKNHLYLNNISSGSFKVYRYENGVETPFYDKIKIGMYVEIQYVSWFKIRDIEECKDEDGSEYLNIELYSIETILCNTNLTSFGSLGSEDDEQGGLDRYCLYNSEDLAHSITHIFIQKNPAWYFKYIDPEIALDQYRSFDVDSISSYEFLVNNVSGIFECIFIFDTYDMSISAYKLDNIGSKTSIFLSDRNFIKSVTTKSSDGDIKTVFNVSGGNDARTNSTLGISEINPSGNNMISNFDYFKDQMSNELQNKLKEYYVAYEENKVHYSSALAHLEELYNELGELQSGLPEDETSTDWTEYGLTELEVKESLYWNNMSLYLNTDTEKYNENYELHEEVQAEITIRETEVKNKNAEITNQIALAKSYIINIQEYLGDDLYKELSCFIYEQDFQDDSFVATTEMTENEILEMQYELMKHAENELAKVCYPQYEMTVDVINFTTRKEFIEYTEQLELGNIITIEWEPGVFIEVRLLEMEIDWDNPENFALKFSNKDLDTDWAILAEIQQQANSTATSVDYNKGAWNVAKQTSVDFKNWRNNTLDAGLQKLQNSDKQEVLFDRTGIILKRWLTDQNKYSSNQVWMTNGQIAFTRDSWQSVCTALGMITLPDDREVYGLNAEYIIGEAVVGENFILRGSGAQLDLSANESITSLTGDIESKTATLLANINEFKSEYALYTQTNDGNINSLSSGIEQNAQAITLKVNANEVINAINVSSEGIKISGNKLDIEGNTTFTSFTDGLSNGTTIINGACIQTGSIDASLITTGTLDADKITVNNLVVGKNVTMGDDAVINWNNVLDTPTIPDDDYITAITKNTITTEYVNALKVTAKSVAAEDITGTLITGKTVLFDDTTIAGITEGLYWAAHDSIEGANIYGAWVCDTNALYANDDNGNRVIELYRRGTEGGYSTGDVIIYGDIKTSNGWLSDLWALVSSLSGSGGDSLDLSGYVTTEKLTEELNNYVKSDDLGNYLTVDDLNSYNYATTEQLSLLESDIANEYSLQGHSHSEYALQEHDHSEYADDISLLNKQVTGFENRLYAIESVLGL